MPYDETKGIPPGYRLEERVRKGMVISGAIVLGVPYVIGINVAAAANFENHSYWLLVPGVGPFLTLATRDDSCNEDGTAGEAVDCIGDAFVRFYLVLDGIMQMTGGTLFLLGVTQTKQVLVRQDVTLRVAPRPIGQSGYGLGVIGTF
jgi:hypothetical protein